LNYFLRAPPGREGLQGVREPGSKLGLELGDHYRLDALQRRLDVAASDGGIDRASASDMTTP